MEGLIGIFATMIIFIPIEIWNNKNNKKKKLEAARLEQEEKDRLKYLIEVWTGGIKY